MVRKPFIAGSNVTDFSWIWVYIILVIIYKILEIEPIYANFSASISLSTHFATLLHGFFVYVCAVRVIRFLFAMYLIALSVYPCSDKETCADELKTSSLAVNVADHNHSDNEMDYCTPFCICACCAAQIQLNQLSEVSLSNPIHNTQVVTLYFEKPLLNNAKSIWQPPKLA